MLKVVPGCQVIVPNHVDRRFKLGEEALVVYHDLRTQYNGTAAHIPSLVLLKHHMCLDTSKPFSYLYFLTLLQVNITIVDQEERSVSPFELF